MIVMMAPFWNDMDWIDATLDYIDFWQPDKLYVCEGCWDPKYPARSNDGTRERLEQYVAETPRAKLMDNLRNSDYRTNQMNQCRSVCLLADAKPGDWFMYAACDAFMFKSDVEVYKAHMKVSGDDYPIIRTYNFWDRKDRYSVTLNKHSPNLPYRLLEGYHWMPPCHLSIRKAYYDQHSRPRSFSYLPVVFHYEGLRNPGRLHEKYSVGDRKSPREWKGGIKLKNMKTWGCNHPEFVNKAEIWK